ncbi:MAG: beta-propeller fold lactonase family protein [Ignavibacteriales bacterium]|nr:beta-propeller fold lactonase family protein [Ignavibacteriales bacterium]
MWDKNRENGWMYNLRFETFFCDLIFGTNFISVIFAAKKLLSHLFFMKKPITLIFFSILLFSSCRKENFNEPKYTSYTIQSLFAINGNNMVTLSWLNGESGTPAGFDIYRDTTEDFELQFNNKIASGLSAFTFYRDTSAKNLQTYYYRIVPFYFDNEIKVLGKTSNVAIGKPFNYDSSFSIIYSEHIQRIFTSSCAVSGCHVGDEDGDGKTYSKSRGGGNVPFHEEQFSLKTWNAAVNGGIDGNFIVPFNAERSDLIAHTNTDTNFAPIILGSAHMPQGVVSLPMNQVRLLAQWINEGAKNDAGGVPFSYSPNGKMYVVNAQEDLIAVIDVELQKLIRYIKVGNQADSTLGFGSPHHIHVDPNGQYFYVTLINIGEVWQFSVNENKFIAKVTNIPKPADLAFSPSGDTIFISSWEVGTNGHIYALKATPTFQMLTNIDLGIYATTPHGLEMSHDGKRLYSTNTTSGNISEISLADFSVQTRSLDTLFTLSQRPYDPYLMEVSENDRFIWVTCKGDSSVRMFDRTISEEHAVRIIPVGKFPLHPDIPYGETEMWVCNSGSDDITIVNLSDYSKITLPNVGRQPHDVEFTPDGSLSFLTLENTTFATPPHHPVVGGKGLSFLVIYDRHTRQKIKTIEVAGWSQNCEYAPPSSN